MNMDSLQSLIFSLLTASVLAFALNLYRTLRLIAPSAKGVIRSGSWTARTTDGSEQMTMHQRAVVACTGLWAMNSHEAIYFTALHDSNGKRLSCRETYHIKGKDFPARWWSITAYRNYQLIANAEQRYSFSKTSMIREVDGSWCLTLSPQPQPRNWIPLGNAPGQLVISLRLYNPDTQAIDEIANRPLPEITIIRSAHTRSAPCATELSNEGTR
jgi:hypothetical protein